ncbi:MAG: accessory factor UbiK family protein [Betaproteobacteria bacterium]|nr:accessory factor UbiK family protein [Betaproteobacteria bacterium]
MNRPDPLDELLARLSRVIAEAPAAADLSRRLRTVLEQGLAQFDLATRSELEAYAQWAAGMRQRVERLEARITELEAAAGASAGSPARPAEPGRPT